MSGNRDEEKTPDLGDDRMDLGMEVAFGATSESVLDTLERLTGVKSRILLVDAEGDESPVVRVPAADEEDGAEDDRRYQILGEIARGGVGVVFKSRDRDLGRDVAIKVLRKDLASVPEVVQRFVEEAQIGGQLQHPGVVPVYGLGVQKDGRPYFAMKLVKGRTLAAMIKDGGDHRPLIRVFERICQTVAYAHARNVLHRDLKPSNVLVGSFGEVQVVDWGFAKVLSRGGNADERRDTPPDLSVIETVRSKGEGSTSRIGSVMGTPPYMSPEQARGDIEKLDERADVFSLGAILTEILTGKPPYLGDAREQIVNAAQAKLDDAMARLDASDADEDLVSLAKRCLSPAPPARPRNAGEVAEAVTEHLASLEEKKKQAELSAAAAHRTRRMTMALAAAILVAVLAGGGGLFLADRAKRDRRDRATAAVNAKLKEANLLLGDARAAQVPDVSGWPAALAAAEEAERLAADLNAPEEVRKEAIGLRQNIAIAASEAGEAARRHDSEQALLDRLAEIRSSRGADFKVEDQDAGYEEAFAEQGIDIRELTPAAAAERVSGWSRAGEVIAALDDWLRVRREREGDTARLTALLTVLDPDETRSKIRTLSAAGETNRLESLTKRDDHPPETLLLLGEALGFADKPEAAVEVYRRLEKVQPNAFGTSIGLAHWLLERSPPSAQEATAQLTKASLLLPQSVAVRYRLAFAYASAKLLDPQIAMLRDVYRIDPDFLDVGYRLYQALCVKCGRADKSKDYWTIAEAAREATGLKPDDSAGWGWLLQALTKTGQVREARTAIARAAELAGENPRALYSLSTYFLRLSEYEESLEVLERCEKAGGGLTGVLANRGIALAALGRLDEAIAAWRRLFEAYPAADAVPRWIGEAHFRAGRLSDAIRAWAEHAGLMPISGTARTLLARGHRALGEEAKARENLDRAIEMQTASAKRVGDSRSYRLLGLRVGRRHDRAGAPDYFAREFPHAAPNLRSSFLVGVGAEQLRYWRKPVEAMETLREAIELWPENVLALRSLAEIHDARDEGEAAIAAQERAIEAGGNRNYRDLMVLARYLGNDWKLRDAIAIYERLIEDLPNETLERELAFKQRLLELSESREMRSRAAAAPETNFDLLALAVLLDRDGDHGGAALKREGLIATLTEEEFGRNYHPSCAMHFRGCASAALRAAGEAGPPDEEGANWRGRALGWLRKALIHFAEQSRTYYVLDTEDKRAEQLALWFCDPDLAITRDEAFLATLPADERTEWNKLWHDIRAHHDLIK